jgi:hypothetical protein
MGGDVTSRRGLLFAVAATLVVASCGKTVEGALVTGGGDKLYEAVGTGNS